MNGLRVLVTGGAGFIGSELVRQLVSSGAEVTVIDNLVNGKRENLADVPGVNLVTADIRDCAAVRGALNSIDIVYHLACLGVRHSIHSPVENHDVNATGTLNLLKWSKLVGVRRFVFVSTSEVYGTASTVPMTEAHPTLPMTVYGASKLAGESYTRAFFRTYGFPTVVLRPFNSFGPRCHHEGDCGEVIPKFLLRALGGQPMIIFGDGAQTRDFTYVRDTAMGILAAGVADGVIGDTLNLGSGCEITINELARTVCRITGRQSTVQYADSRPGDVLRLCSDSTNARHLLAFEPQVTLEQGLAHLKAWYQERGLTPAELLQAEKPRNWEAGSETDAKGLFASV
ncbi:MAG: GDP-mannose 4,6-dehydratase [Acidobacteria bacterium]|nr:GDP-mannose 4,6-dehydratase [Acidobacteriota bacterium]